MLKICVEWSGRCCRAIVPVAFVRSDAGFGAACHDAAWQLSDAHLSMLML